MPGDFGRVLGVKGFGGRKGKSGAKKRRCK